MTGPETPGMTSSQMWQRILVVGPDDEQQKKLCSWLEQSQLQADCLETPEQAQVPGKVSRPVVVLLSESLGASALQQLKSQDNTAHLSILVVVSEDCNPEVQAEWLEAGACDVLCLASPRLFLARLHRVLENTRLMTELREKVIRDELTGVFSRRYLFESMRQHVNQFSRPGPPVLSCLMIDVDHFKNINDQLGHVEGDRILRLVAERIFGITRKGDVVARFGGEEFVVILPSTDAQGAELVAEKLRQAVEATCGVTISIGVSWYESPPEVERRGLRTDEEMMHLLLSRADAALYSAKREGRNRVCLISRYSGPERRRKVRLEAPFRAQVSRADGLRLERIAEVSVGGMSLHDSAPLEVGDRLQVTLLLEEGRARVEGRVVWSFAIRGGGQRCGVAFDDYLSGREQLVHELGHRARIAPR